MNSSILFTSIPASRFGLQTPRPMTTKTGPWARGRLFPIQRNGPIERQKPSVLPAMGSASTPPRPSWNGSSFRRL